MHNHYLSGLRILGVLGLALAASPAVAKPVVAAKPPADSLALLQQAVARDSNSVDQLFRLGNLLLDRDRVEEAVQVYTRASRLAPGDLRVLVNLGAAHDAAGRGPRAQEHYRRALEIAPDDSIAACRLASSLYAQGEHGPAVDLLRRVVATKPRSHCAYFTLGVAFADAGLYRDAVRMWRKVVELAPESPEAVSARESIEVLEALQRQPQAPGHDHSHDHRH